MSYVLAAVGMLVTAHAVSAQVEYRNLDGGRPGGQGCFQHQPVARGRDARPGRCAGTGHAAAGPAAGK